MWNKCCLALVFVLFSMAALAFPKSPMSVNEVPRELASTARNLEHVLRKHGFDVKRGYFRLYTTDDCPYSFEVMKSCYANNPAAPYVLPTVPFWRDEFVDPATISALGLTRKGYTSSFRFDPREAIVILAQLPPPAAYFGLQTYQFTHKGTYKTDSNQYQFVFESLNKLLDIFFAEVPRNSDRIQSLSSLSNSINNVVIERQSGQAFDQMRFFIITPDKLVDEGIRNAFHSLQIDDHDIFTEPIPSTAASGITVGLGEDADDFATVIRYAKPDDEGGIGTRSYAWRNDLPMIVLRARYTYTNREPEPYPAATLENRTGWDETPLMPQLVRLISLVSAKWGQPCSSPGCPLPTLNMQEPPPDLVGPDCTAVGMNCLADTQDTVYEMAPRVPLDEGEVYAVVGPLSTETTNATYVSIGVNNSYLLEGVGEVSNKLLAGTALEFASDLTDPDKFFVYYFTRDCKGLESLTNGQCFSISTDMIPACTGDPAKCPRLGLTVRAYIRPGTQRGPDAAKILPSVVIPLRRP